jgi:plastocyanin
MSRVLLLIAWTIGLWGFAGAAAEAKSIQIVMTNLAYVPAETSAAVGDVIEWVNSDFLAHTATATNSDWNVVIIAKKTERLVLKKVRPG